MTRLERLYDKKNPYSNPSDRFGGPGTRWDLDHKKEITEYESEKIAVTKKYHDLLFEEYGLTDEDFIVSKQTPTTAESISNKILVKKLPGLRIENNIEYV